MSDFNSIITAHNKRMVERRQATEQAQLAFSASLEELTSSVLVDIATTSKSVYSTQKQVEQEAKQLEQRTLHVLHETKEWNDDLNQFKNSLKQLGDIVNWAQVIEADMRFISKGLDSVVLASQQPPLQTKK